MLKANNICSPNKRTMIFRDNKDLESYYENKYAEGGYKPRFTLFGVDISEVYHKERHATAIEMLAPKKTETILEAGCGTGELALKIAQKAHKVFAVDIAANAFLKTKEEAPENIIFSKENVENLSFPDASFDKIISIETLEHVMHADKMLNELSRTLKKNGELILTYPTVDQTIMAKIEKFFRIRNLSPFAEHLTEWSYSEAVKNVEKHGLNLVKVTGVSFDFGFLERKIGKMSKQLLTLVLRSKLAIKCFPRNSCFLVFKFKKP